MIARAILLALLLSSVPSGPIAAESIPNAPQHDAEIGDFTFRFRAVEERRVDQTAFEYRLRVEVIPAPDLSVPAMQVVGISSSANTEMVEEFMSIEGQLPAGASVAGELFIRHDRRFAFDPHEVSVVPRLGIIDVGDDTLLGATDIGIVAASGEDLVILTGDKDPSGMLTRVEGIQVVSAGVATTLFFSEGGYPFLLKREDLVIRFANYDLEAGVVDLEVYPPGGGVQVYARQPFLPNLLALTAEPPSGGSATASMGGLGLQPPEEFPWLQAASLAFSTAAVLVAASPAVVTLGTAGVVIGVADILLSNVYTGRAGNAMMLMSLTDCFSPVPNPVKKLSCLAGMSSYADLEVDVLADMGATQDEFGDALARIRSDGPQCISFDPSQPHNAENNIPPTVSLLGIGEGATLSAPYSVTADVRDECSQLGVTFAIWSAVEGDGSLVSKEFESEIQASPYHWDVDMQTLGLGAGYYFAVVTAIDDFSAAGSDSRYFRFEPPQIDCSLPENNQLECPISAGNVPLTGQCIAGGCVGVGIPPCSGLPVGVGRCCTTPPFQGPGPDFGQIQIDGETTGEQCLFPE